MGERRNYYEVLGVQPTADTATIRESFRRLARERHPDRFSGSARMIAEREFQAITEAFNVLSNSQQRSRYDQGMAGGASTAPTDPREISRALDGRAIAAARAKDLDKAEELFRQAIAHDAQNARAQHHFAAFLVAHRGRIDEALRLVDQAAKLDPMNPEVLLDASRMFARAGMLARAMRLARGAAALLPGDEAVESWLRQLEEEKVRAERGR
jgi:curved DNA-binding protein CbpA